MIKVFELYYPIIQIPENVASALEQLGTKPKFWFRDDSKHPNLFKIGREGTGENWAEKVASEIAELLGLPHAKYELAVCGDQEGVVTPSFRYKGERMVFGNEVLSLRFDHYVSQQRYNQSQHTVRAVMAIMRSSTIKPPSSWKATKRIKSAADVFIGYMMFDAWIGNTDRHHENWAFINKPGEGIRLAPTFDHASSLGRELFDANRRDRLTTPDPRRDINSYIMKARSAFYHAPNATKPLSPIDAFFGAAKNLEPAGLAWLERLERIQVTQLEKIFEKIPPGKISKSSRQFALRMLHLTREKLLDRRKEL